MWLANDASSCSIYTLYRIFNALDRGRQTESAYYIIGSIWMNDCMVSYFVYTAARLKVLYNCRVIVDSWDIYWENIHGFYSYYWSLTVTTFAVMWLASDASSYRIYINPCCQPIWPCSSPKVCTSRSGLLVHQETHRWCCNMSTSTVQSASVCICMCVLMCVTVYVCLYLVTVYVWLYLVIDVESFSAQLSPAFHPDLDKRQHERPSEHQTKKKEHSILMLWLYVK